MTIIKPKRHVAAAFASVAAIAAILALPVANASADCSTATFTSSGGSCTLAGEATLVPGQLGITTAPAEIDFGSTTLDGAVQWASFTDPYTVTDDTGTGDGWNLTAAYDAAAGPFINTTIASGDPGYQSTLADLETNGDTSGTSPDSGAATAAAGTEDSTAATNGTSYPVTVPTTQVDDPGEYDPVVIFNAASASGMGVNNITQAWWLQIPDDAYSGSYTTTLDLDLNSGPGTA